MKRISLIQLVKYLTTYQERYLKMSRLDEFPNFVNEMQSALVEVFGEQLVSENRSNIQRIIMERLMPGGRWVPHHTFNPMMSTDFHAWCVNERGVIHDYPPDQLIKGNHWTGDVVRRPWDVNVVVEGCRTSRS